MYWYLTCIIHRVFVALIYAIIVKKFVILAKILLNEIMFFSKDAKAQRRKEINFKSIFLIREIRQNS